MYCIYVGSFELLAATDLVFKKSQYLNVYCYLSTRIYTLTCPVNNTYWFNIWHLLFSHSLFFALSLCFPISDCTFLVYTHFNIFSPNVYFSPINSCYNGFLLYFLSIFVTFFVLCQPIILLSVFDLYSCLVNVYTYSISFIYSGIFHFVTLSDDNMWHQSRAICVTVSSSKLLTSLK